MKKRSIRTTIIVFGVISLQFLVLEACYSQQHLIPVLNKNGHVDYINAFTSKVHVQTKATVGMSFSEGLAAVSYHPPKALHLTKYGYIDLTGKVVIPPKYGSASEFHNGMAIVSLGGFPSRIGAIDHSGKVIIPFKFAGIGNFAFGLAPARSKWEDANGKQLYGYIDTRGNWVIPPRYVHANPFSEGLAAVTVTVNGKNRLGFINTQHEMVIAPQFPVSSDDGVIYETRFSESLAVVPHEKGEGYIDRHGKFVIPPNPDAQYLSPFKEGYAHCKFEQNSGIRRYTWKYIDRTGKQYEHVPYKNHPYSLRAYYNKHLVVKELSSRSLALVRSDGKNFRSGFLDINGGYTALEHDARWPYRYFMESRSITDFLGQVRPASPGSLAGKAEGEIIKLFGKPASISTGTVNSFRDASDDSDAAWIHEHLPASRHDESIRGYVYGRQKSENFRFTFWMVQEKGTWVVFSTARVPLPPLKK